MATPPRRGRPPALPPQVARAVFDLVVHAAWADGRLDLAEVSAARAAAAWLDPEGAWAPGRLTLGPDHDLPAIVSLLGGAEVALAFALATWMTLADGVERPRETALLDRFRLVAGVPSTVSRDLRRVVNRARARYPAPDFASQLSDIVDALGPLRTAA